jgi:hypothetical protein
MSSTYPTQFAGITLPNLGVLQPGQKITSANGTYYLTVTTTGPAIYNNTTGQQIWSQGLAPIYSPYTLAVTNAGTLQALDSNKTPRWTSPAPAKANPPYVLIINSNGIATLSDSSGNVVWSS